MRNYVQPKQIQEEMNPAMPLVGPSSYEEALSRIDNGIREMDNGGGYTWEEVKRH